MFNKIRNHLRDNTLFCLIKDKIRIGFYDFINHNRNVTLLALQCSNYKRLRRKFRKVLESDLDVNNREKSNKVWFCWFQGLEKSPDIVKCCYNSLKETLGDREIVLLTEKNIKDYVELPDYIERKYKNGIISQAHYSDLIRISLLCKYGGVWIDATVLCTSKDYINAITNYPLFVFKQVYLSKSDLYPIVASNWFISSESNNPICLMTQKLLFAYWKKYNYVVDYFIFHYFFAMSCEKYSDLWSKVPTFNNVNPHILQFELNDKYDSKRWNQIINNSGIHKLNHHNEYANDDSMYSHIISTYMSKESNKNDR